MSDYQTEVLALNPVGYWRLGEPSGTNAADLGSGANDGTYTNTPTLAVAGALTDDTDTAVTFTGASSEYATMGDVLGFATGDPLTLMCWFKTTAAVVTTSLVGKLTATGTIRGYALKIRSTGQMFLVLSSTDSGPERIIVETTPTGYNDGNWHCMVATYDGSTGTGTGAAGVTLYVDGVAVAMTITTDTLNIGETIVTTASLNIGARDGTNEYFDGTLDEVAVFDAALTAKDAARLYYTGLGHLDRYEQDVLGLNPVGYWRLGEASGTNAVDETVSANDGTYTNTPVLGVFGAISEDLDTAITCASATSEYVTMGDVLDYERTDTFSLSGWFRTTTAAEQAIVSKEEGVPDFSGYDLRVNSSGAIILNLISATGSRLTMTTTATTFADGAWHFVVATYDGSSSPSGVTIYVDGASEALTTTFDTLTTAITNIVALQVGARSDGSLYFDGDLDEVAVYDYELTSVEQAFLHASGIYTSPGLDADYRNTVLQLNPLGYWRLGEASGTNAVDEMRRNDGTYTNTPTLGATGALTGDADTAVTFAQATSEYVTMGDVLDFDYNEPFTMSGWFKTGYSGAVQGIMRKELSATTYRGYGIVVTTTGEIDYQLVNDSSSNILHIKTTATGFADDVWHFVVATYDGSTNASGVHIYVDGVDEALTTTTDTLSATTLTAAPFQLGARNSADNFFDGELDELAIFARELTAKDVAAMYYKGIGKQSNEYEVLKLNPVGYWRLGEASGTNAVDAVGNNDGTYNNVPVLGTTGLLVGDPDTAVTFDRTASEDVTMGNVLPFERTDPFSLCCWVNCSEAVSSVGLVGKTDSTGKGYSIYLSSGNLTGLIANAFTTNGIRIRVLAATTADGADHFLAMTYDGSSSASGMKLYIDGVLQSDIDITQDNLTSSILSTAQCTVGSFGSGGTYADGVIDEPAIFGTELTAQELHDIYTYGKQYRTTLSSFSSAMWEARPIAWWRLGETSGTNAVDVAGGNDGTYTNTPTLGAAGAIASDTDTAVTFVSASSEYTTMGDVLDFDKDDPFSASVWFKTSTAAFQMMISKQEDSAPYKGWGVLVTSTGQVSYYLYNSSASNNRLEVKSTSTAFADGEWHHLVVTYDGSTNVSGVTLYVDGVSIPYANTYDTLTLDTLTAFPLNVSGRNDTGSLPFDGTLDEAAIFDYELTAAQARRIFWEAAGHSRYSLAQLVNAELKGYWRLGELSGTSAVDETGNTNGVYVGTPTLASTALVPNETDPSVYFDEATPEYVDMGDILDFTHTDTFSIGCWVDTTSANASFVTKYGTAGFILYIASGVLTVILSATVSTDEIRVTFGAASTYNDGVPHFFVLTYDGSTNASGMTMYVDGIVISGTTVTDNLTTSPTNAASLNIASRNDGAAVNMTGTADEVWKAAGEMTADEVANAYIAGLLSYTESDGPAQYIVAITESPSIEGVIGASADHAVVDSTNVVEALTVYWGRTLNESFNLEVGIGLITTLTEAFNTSTSITSLRNQIGAVVEAVQFALTENIEHAKGVLEGLAMNEAGVANAILQGNLSDTLSYADVIQLTWDQLQTETINITDPSTAYAQKAAVLAELFVSAGIVSTIHKAAGIIAEAIILQDLVERYFELSAVENVTMTDAEATLYRAVAANIEAAAMADSLTGTMRLSLLISDSLTEGDLVDVNQVVCEGLYDDAIFGGAITLPDGVFSAIVLNTESMGISEYSNYPFNSFGKLQNDYLGASDTDIYKLTGDDDAGTDIDAVIRTGMTNFGTNVFKRVPRAYLGYTSDGGLIMKTISTSGGTKTERWYELTPRTGDHASGAHAAARIKLGRGIKATYWQFELINKLGSDFDIDMLQLYPMILSRRV